MVSIGQRLREARKRANKTLEQVSEDLNMSLSGLAMYERNERVPPSDKLRTLADYYGVSADWVLGRTDDVNVDPDSFAERAAYRLDGYGELSPEAQEQLRDYYRKLLKKHGRRVGNKRDSGKKE